MPAIVDSTQCHLWTDALHTRQLAREALNRWDRGTYVRMTVTTVWTALETSCQEALSDPKIGYRFKENLDRAIGNVGLTPIDWSRGIWERVRELQERRKTYVHRFLTLADMFPEASVADEAIVTVREAIGDICQRAGKPQPTWLDIDSAHGWQAKPNLSCRATITVGRDSAQADDPTAIKIFMVVDGKELLTTILPAGSDPIQEIEDLIASAGVPISCIRVYEGDRLMQELSVNMRGSA